MDPIEVSVRRGGVVEATHAVHAVAVRDGAVVEAAGDSGRVAYLRSSAKPFQALPLVRARDDLGDRGDRDRLRVAPRHPGAARRRAQPAREGARDRGRARVRARADPRSSTTARASTPGCSRSAGRRAGRVAATGSRRTPSSTAACTRSPPRRTSTRDEIPTAVDGCGVLTFALPLERMARMFGRLEQLDGGARVAAAMRAHPELIRGPMAPTRCSCASSRAGRRRAEPRGCSARAARTGSGSRSRSRTGRCARSGRRSPSSPPARVRDGRARRRAARNSRGELVGEVVSDR